MYIGIDIGGTHIRVASGANGEIKQKIDFPTREFHASIQEIKGAVEKGSLFFIFYKSILFYNHL